MPEEAILLTLGIKKEGLDRVLSRTIRDLMANKNFAFWALNPKVDVICTNSAMRLVVEAMQQGKNLALTKNEYLRAAKLKVLSHPYYRGQLYSGVSDKEGSRIVFNDGLIWKTMEEKREYERKTKVPWVVHRRKKLMRKEEVPSWVHLPVY